MVNDKKELRIRMKRVRSEISDKKEQEQKVHEKFYQMELYRKTDTFLCYYPLQDEWDLIPFMDQAAKDGKKLLLPRMTGPRTMEFVPYIPGDPMKEGPFHVMEPIGKAQEVFSDASVILVPGLAFDSSGGRMGYGAGFYDTYITDHPLKTLAFCFREQVIDRVPMEATDQRIDRIISDQEL